MPATDLVESSLLFSRWRDPRSGVESFLLDRRIAPLQQSFYYTNPSFSADGRYLWLYCAFPPSGSGNQGRQLAVVDFEEQTLRHFPDTQFLDASPAVDPENGHIYWCIGSRLWRRGPGTASTDAPQPINRLPAELVRNRRPWRVATHLTFSADRRAFAFDAEIGRQWFVGHLPLDGSPPVLWQEFDRCYNHAQFSPTDRDLILVNQDSWIDPVTGECPNYENRMWLLRRGERARPIFPDAAAAGAAKHGHEWWAASGLHVCYIHYGRGAMRIDPFDPAAQPETLWASDTVSHAHTGLTEDYVVADCIPGPSVAPGRVIFHNRRTGKTVEIVSDMPYVSESLRGYHVHPHPQFALGDRYICYTTLVRGQVDLALVPVKQLIDHTS